MPGAGRWLKNQPPRTWAGPGCIGNVYPATGAGRAGTVILRQPPAIFGNRRPVSAAGYRSGQPEYGSKLAGHGICIGAGMRAARRTGAITSISAPGSPWKAVR